MLLLLLENLTKMIMSKKEEIKAEREKMKEEMKTVVSSLKEDFKNFLESPYK